MTFDKFVGFLHDAGWSPVHDAQYTNISRFYDVLQQYISVLQDIHKAAVALAHTRDVGGSVIRLLDEYITLDTCLKAEASLVEKKVWVVKGKA